MDGSSPCLHKSNSLDVMLIVCNPGMIKHSACLTGVKWNKAGEE